MKIRSRSQPTTDADGLTGPARVDRRTSGVLRRAQAGDVAVVDHLDLDRSTAEALVAHGVVAVVNSTRFISGRYPNLGPEVLARAGVRLVEGVGHEVFTRLSDGDRVTLRGGDVLVKDQVVASGEALDLDAVVHRMDEAREGLTTQLQSFTHNTTEFLRREQDLLLHGRGMPDLQTRIAGRPAVVVVRDFDYATDLKMLRRYIREQDPVLVAVDGGADALLALRRKPDVLVIGADGFAGHSGTGPGAAVSDKALRAAREVVLHADSSDRLVGAERLERLGIRPARLAANGTTEDIALLLADIKGASLIVTVGTHATLDEFLDRQRSGLASTFLTRLRVGSKIVDAENVPALYAGRVRLWHLALVLLVGLLALAAAVSLTPQGKEWVEELRPAYDSLVSWIQGLFT